jgi:hypothetical protein
MTNGDYIRSLTDEQLADLFDEMCGAYNPCRFCVTHKDVCDYNCAPNVEIWLKQEHEDENHTEPVEQKAPAN